MISPQLRKFLDDLEERIDPEQEECLLQAWKQFAAGGFTGQIFHPKRARKSPPHVEWPKVKINSALFDFDQMALQQYGQVSQVLENGSGAILNVRCNYGSSILPSLFGVEMFIMDEDYDTLPTSRPLNDLDAIRRLVDQGVPAPRSGWGDRVMEMGERFAEIAREYPKIGKYVYIYHPDTQGPMDVLEVIWGSTMFYNLYDQPQLVHAMLEIITQAYIDFMHAWMEIVPFRPDGNAHWGHFYRGNLMIRDDSAMNLSRSMFDEFILPYDQRLLEEFDGGAIHFCGKGDHYIPSMTKMNKLYAINLSQPHLNNMEKIFAHTVDKGITILDLDRKAAEAAIAQGRDLHGFVHCSQA